MQKFETICEEELNLVNGGVVVEVALLSLAVSTLGGSFTAGYIFGKDLANRGRRP